MERPERKTPRRPDTGQLGETLAAEWLARAGYRIVARNLRTRHGEIDVLVRRRRLYVAVEVKTRSFHNPAPERSLLAEQAERLRRALDGLATSLRPRPRLLRIDIIAVRLALRQQDPEGDSYTEIRHFPGQPFRRLD